MHRTSISHQLPAARMSVGLLDGAHLVSAPTLPAAPTTPFFHPRRPRSGERAEAARRPAVIQDGRALRPGDRATLDDALAGGPA